MALKKRQRATIRKLPYINNSYTYSLGESNNSRYIRDFSDFISPAVLTQQIHDFVCEERVRV